MHTQKQEHFHFHAQEIDNSDVNMGYDFEATREIQLQGTQNSESGASDLYASMPLAPMVQEAPAMFPTPFPAADAVDTVANGSRWPCPRLSISEQSPPSVAYVGPKDVAASGSCQVSVWDMLRPPSAPSPGWRPLPPSPGWRPLCGGGGPKAAASPSSVLGLGLTPGSRGGGAGLTWDTLRPAATPGAGGFSTPGLSLGGLGGTPGTAGGGAGGTGFTPRFGWGGDWASPAAGGGGAWGGEAATEAQARRRPT
jgi:hypothetical protein